MLSCKYKLMDLIIDVSSDRTKGPHSRGRISGVNFQCTTKWEKKKKGNCSKDKKKKKKIIVQDITTHIVLKFGGR